MGEVGLICPVPLDQLEWYWPVAQPQLQRAFDLSESDSAQGHFQALLDDLEQLWRIAGKAWAITRVKDGKRGRVLEFVALGGDGLADWKQEFFSTAEAWGKSHGCVTATFTGRRGWIKALPDYTQKRVTLAKEL